MKDFVGTRIGSVLLLSVFAWSGACSQGEEVAKPIYPLYAIASGSPELSEMDAKLLAQCFTLVQAQLSSETIERLHQVNPDFRAVHYFNSTYTSGGEDVVEVESRFRGSLAMYQVGLLGEPIQPDSASFQLMPVAEGEAISLKASTSEEETSSDGTNAPSTEKYVTWIRIGDELMRVQSFEPSTGRVGVRRGLDETASTGHKKGEPVFSPVYLGSVNDTGAWPGGPGRYLRYAFDPAKPDGTEWRLKQMVEAMEEGYDGVWLDICSASPFNMADSDGGHTAPWDFRTGGRYQLDTYREGQEIKVDAIQNRLREKFGGWPVVIANNMKARTFEVGTGGQRALLEKTELKARPLDGYCIENYAGGFPSRAADRAKYKGPKYHEVEEWLANQEMLATCAQEGLSAYPMIANAGSKSVLLEGLGPIRDQFEMFAYASYLLCVEANGPTQLGIPAFYREGDRRFVRLHPRYTWPLGAPSKSVKPEEFETYRAPGHVTFSRSFQNGLVLVNPSEADDAELDLDQTYIDPESGEEISRIVVAAHSGRILMLPGTL